MHRVLLSFVFALTLSITMVGFAGGIPAAHAAGQAAQVSSSKPSVGWETIETKTIPAPPEECAAIIKANPKLASNPQGCNITFTSKTSASPQASQVEPNGCCGCPDGVRQHSFTVQGPLGAYGTEMDTTFHWDGWCNVLTIDYQNCTRNTWATFPFGISVTGCSTFTDGIKKVAEEDCALTYFGVYQNSFWMRSSADAWSFTVADTNS